MHTTPTGNVTEAPELGTPCYKVKIPNGVYCRGIQLYEQFVIKLDQDVAIWSRLYALSLQHSGKLVTCRTATIEYVKI